MEIQEKLFALQDRGYAEFQSKLTPGIPRETFIGVRVPQMRRLAKSYISNPECKVFLETLPHLYYDENMLHGLVLSEMKDYDACMKAVELFLPYVDNWAVCDTICPKVFQKHKAQLLIKIKEWAASEHVYTCRFGLGMLMRHFLDEDYSSEYLQIVADVHSEAYYVNMMIAWFFATALAKQWDTAILCITENRLDQWVHNKAIQKARESDRITAEQKEYLKGLKR